MRRRGIGYGLWVLLALGLYFFENNAGSRVVLICTLLAPLLPFLRRALFRPAEGRRKPRKAWTQEVILESQARFQEEEEPGEIRAYMPGDPVNRIHWKLSAKREELLIRENGREAAWEEARAEHSVLEETSASFRKRNGWSGACAIVAGLALLLLFLIPEAWRGTQALLNRLFEVSEGVNTYVYTRFPMAEEQSVGLATLLLSLAGAASLGAIVLSKRKAPALGAAAACVAFQVYFGLAFPAWIQVPLFALFALWMVLPEWNPRQAGRILAVIGLVSLAVWLLYPGVDGVTEAASEQARDWLSQRAEQFVNPVSESGSGENETRHARTMALQPGDQEAREDQAYRLETVEEEQISLPHWVNYLRIILLLLLAMALVILPFVPFLWMNARRARALAARGVFTSENISEAICAIFQHVVAWLEATGHGAASNLPYVHWADALSPELPAGYARQFEACAQLFEEAAYSDHPMTEEQRRQALALLEKTEGWLLARADWKQKLQLKYGKCLYA